jgi:hypothetical protein
LLVVHLFWVCFIWMVTNKCSVLSDTRQGWSIHRVAKLAYSARLRDSKPIVTTAYSTALLSFLRTLRFYPTFASPPCYCVCEQTGVILLVLRP